MEIKKLFYCDRCGALNSYPLPCHACGHNIMIVKIRVADSPPRNPQDETLNSFVDESHYLDDIPGDNAGFCPETPKDEPTISTKVPNFNTGFFSETPSPEDT